MELWQAVLIVVIFSIMFVGYGKILYQRGYSDGKWREWEKAYQTGFDDCSANWSMTAEEECSCDFCLFARETRKQIK